MKNLLRPILTDLRVCVNVLLRYDFRIFLRNVGVPVNGYIKRL